MLSAQAERVSTEHEQVTAELQTKIDHLHVQNAESDRSIDNLKQKIAKLEQSNKDRQSKVDAAEKTRARIEADLKAKVSLKVTKLTWQ